MECLIAQWVSCPKSNDKLSNESFILKDKQGDVLE